MSSEGKISQNKTSLILIAAGSLILLTGLIILWLTFFPVINEEVKYTIAKPTKLINQIKPVNEDFGIIIPKIGANAKVLANIDPFNEAEYQSALTRGVAHAKGSVFPGQIGNVFIFAHSAGNFYDANRYNAIFYLLSKLEKKDEIYLIYQGKKYRYQVTEKKLVDASAISFISAPTDKKTVTLMTCWPPGTTLKRLIVMGKIL